MYNRKIVDKKEILHVRTVRVTELAQFILNVRKFHRQDQRTLQLV